MNREQCGKSHVSGGSPCGCHGLVKGRQFDQTNGSLSGKLNHLRRLNDCHVIYPAPFELPTLRGFPPPVPSACEPPPAALRRRITPVSYTPPAVRSRTYRRLHDCRFIPNFTTAMELFEARRFVYEYESLGREPRKPLTRESPLSSPLGIGLMLAFIPPLAVALVWSSKHFAQPAKIAITIYGMFTFMALLVAAFFGLHG